MPGSHARYGFIMLLATAALASPDRRARVIVSTDIGGGDPGDFRNRCMGGDQGGDLSNLAFPQAHVKGHGHLGDLVMCRKKDIKMGDTPSVLYLLHGDLERPESKHGGGAFLRPDPEDRPHYWHGHQDPARQRTANPAQGP